MTAAREKQYKNKKSKDKKKKKKEKEVDGEKLKKKKRKEKKEGKKDSALEATERNKADNVKKDKQPVHKARDDKQESASEGKTEVDSEKRKPVVQSDKPNKPAILRTFDAPPSENMVDGLYGDMEDTRIDDTVIANYGKVIAEEGSTVKVKEENKGLESGGEADGLESSEVAESLGTQQGEQVVKEENIEEARIKSEGGSDSDGAKSEKANVMLAPLPEPSKWELEEEFTPSSTFEKKDNDDRASTGSTGVDKGSAGKVVTSEVLKRAENAIFQKAINAIRPIEPTKKATGDRKIYTGAEKEKRLAGEVVVASAAESSDANARKLLDKDTREARKTANSIQITIPIAGNHAERSVEISSVESSQQASKSKGKPERQKFTGGSGGSQWGDASDSMSPHRVSAKERLGARVDGENDKKHDDERSRSRNIGRHRSRSESRDRKHGASKKGLKSTVEKKRTVSRSRSRSPHHGRKVSERKHQDVVDPRRYADGRYVDAVPERKYAVASDRGTDSRGKRMEREGRYVEGERHLQERVNDGRRREHSETKKDVTKSPERRRERSESRDRKSDKTHIKQKEEREKSVEKVKKHKTKKKAKRRSESRSRKKSVSDRELKRGKKKDKKHKKDKGKKHKGNEKEKPEKEDEKGDKETGDMGATKDSKSGISTNEATDAVRNEPSGTAEDDQSKEKTRKGGRRNPRLASDRKKSTLDEASFEPDYDASSSVDTEVEEGVEGDKKIEGTDKKTVGSKDASPLESSPTKKRDRSTSADPSEQKRPKLDKDSEKAEKGGGEETSKKSNGGNGKSGTGSKASSKKRGRSVSSSDSSDEDSSDEDEDDSSSGSSSSSDDDSSDDSSVHRRRKKKSRHRRRGKRSKKSSRRASNSSSDSDSESESGSSSDSGSGRGRRGSGRSKKHKHRSKASKKKKKSKHR